MGRLEDLNKVNEVRIFGVSDERFSRYGRVIPGFDAAELREPIRYMEERTPIPEEGNIYIASDPDLESLPVIKACGSAVFGGAEIQAGYCSGRNTTVNGFEYHKAPEVNIAVTDFMLVLGDVRDISPELTYSVDAAEVFYIPAGTVIELFGTTLHLSPLRTSDEGFRNIVILPRGTNTPLSEEELSAARKALENGDREARLLLQKNKWVIAHPEREPLIRQGAHAGVTGQNRELQY